MKVKTSIDKGWSRAVLKGVDGGLLEMATDIHAKAVILAPHASGALVNSGEITQVNEGYKIKFGNSRVPYAKRRHYENKKNPQTLKYLERAGDSVVRADKAKFFRNKI